MKYPKTVQALFDAFTRAGRDLYLVGGAVRDFELGQPFESLDDLDFCTDARPPETIKILRDGGFSVYELGAEFGTVGAVLYAPSKDDADTKPSPHAVYPKDCQITTYRSEEFYQRGSRHPSVEFGDTIEQDLGRRDFSINSIALDRNGDLFDPYDGKKDLEAGILRVIGDPLETLAEDPLRILRVGRFISKLGFEPTPELREAADARADGILDISAERWLQEMTKLLRGDYLGESMLFLHQIRILGMILPEVDALFDFYPGKPLCSDSRPDNSVEDDAVVGEIDDGGVEDEVAAQPGPFWRGTIRAIKAAPRVEAGADSRLRWALLLQHIGKRWTKTVTPDGDGQPKISYPGHQKVAAHAAGELAARFRFDNETTREVRALLLKFDADNFYAPEWSDPQIRRFVRRADPYLDPLLNFARASAAAIESDDVRQNKLASIEAFAARIDQLAAEQKLRPELPGGIGNPLMKQLGLKPSPLIGELKNWLEEEIIDERIESRQSADYYVDYTRRVNPSFLAES